MTVTVLRAGSGKRLVSAYDVDGFVWVPRHPHRLVVATCGAYGEASLKMWEGGALWRRLHRVRHPENECFTLFGATADGTQIVYGHAPDLDSSVAPLDRKRVLRLPR